MPNDSTKTYYEQNAEAYATQTLPARLDKIWDAFSALLVPGAYVLDLGCGSGRDLKELARRGLRVVGIDYSAKLADIARKYSGQEVRVADVRNYNFGEEQFDGIWAVASLLHVPRNEIAGVLGNLSQHLRSGGILLTSMKEGKEPEIGKDGRRFELYQQGDWETLLGDAGFTVEQRQQSTDRRYTNLGDEIQIKWFVTICRK